MNMCNQMELSIEEAKNLCEQYKHLSRSSLLMYDHIEVVKEVMPAPFNGHDQWLFFESYQQTKNIITALSFYKLEIFDVIVLLNKCYPDGLIDYQYMTLRSYLNQQNVINGDGKSAALGGLAATYIGNEWD